MEPPEIFHCSKFFDEDSSGIVKFKLDGTRESIPSCTQVDGPKEDVKLIKRLHKVHGPIEQMDFNEVLILLRTQLKWSSLYRQCWQNAERIYSK